MKHFEIKGSLRADLGKKASKAVRISNDIPCVLYGGENNVHFSTAQSDVRKFIYTPEVMFADITIDGKTYVSMVKDIQFHPVSDKVIHIDFLEVNPEKFIKIKIPVKCIGNSPGVKAGGKLKQNFKKITVKGLMNNIPDFYEVDISKLKIGQSIKVKDLQTENLEFIDSKSNIIVSVITARVVVEEEPVGEDEKAETEAEAETATE